MRELERENRELRRPTRSSRARRLSSGRSSTAAPRSEPLQSRPTGRGTGRPICQVLAVAPVELVRRPLPATLGPNLRDAELKREISRSMPPTSASMASARPGADSSEKASNRS